MDEAAVGIDLGGTNVRMGVVLRSGEMKASARMRTDVHEGVDKVINRMVSCVEALRKKTAGKVRLAGVGIGVPGIISLPEGVVRFSPNLPGWVDIPLRRMLEDRTGIRVKVENDANAYALGEARFGSGKGASSLVCITLGTGVGGGIILGGDLVRGADGMAGEVGHITVRPNGIKCNCGNRGCVERYSSASAVAVRTAEALRRGVESSLSEAFEADPSSITAHVVHEAALGGDRLARRMFRDAGRCLGILAADLINLLNVERILVGGGMAGAWELLSGPMRDEIKKRAFDIPAARCSILKGSLGDDAAVLGAAGLVLSKRH